MAKWVYLGKLKKNMPKGKVREGRVEEFVGPLNPWCVKGRHTVSPPHG